MSSQNVVLFFHNKNIELQYEMIASIDVCSQWIMSVNSAQTDKSAKYHRLAADYVKARSQISVLKAAVIEEKEATTRLRADLQTKEVDVRKYVDENEGLLFRNAQLLKRVEALQATLEEAHRLHAAKGKKVSANFVRIYS